MLFDELSCFVFWAAKLIGGVSSYIICGSILVPSGEESGVGDCQVWVTVWVCVYSRVHFLCLGFIWSQKLKSIVKQ